ncbi:lysophospholipid acyltransferase family protein [Oscillospiraceae bacterium PP1C4]
MRTIIWFINFWISLVALVPSMLRAKRLTADGKLEACDALVQRKVHGWMSRVLRLAGVCVTVNGLENIPDTPVIFVSNHQGNFDIPILLCYLDKPHGIVAKMQLKKLPFINVWMDYLGCVFIDRDNPRQSVAALNDAAQKVQNGQSIIIFPEGTRSRSNQIGAFKSGAFRIASKAKVPIVPIRIDGSYKIMEANHMWIKPAAVNVQIFPPIETAALSKDEFRNIEDRVREIIVAGELNEMYKSV